MTLRSRFQDLRSNLGANRSIEERHRIYVQIARASRAQPSFYLLVVLSTTIAAFGLLANSTAVVIGAMLVAPLMHPIFGIALGLTAGSRPLFFRAAAAEAAGALLCILLAAFIGAVSPHPPFGSEILVRTQPTVYDIIVALASGLAGAYAIVDERISPALPGVAIATALVPPLTTSGLCLAAGRWDWALGAFLLFFANLLAIEIAATAVFASAGLARAGSTGAWNTHPILRRFGLSLVLLAAVAVFLTNTLVGLVAERRFHEHLQRALTSHLRSTVGAHLDELQYRRTRGRVQAVAIVLTPQEFTPNQVADMEAKIRREVDRGIDLVVRSLLSRDVSSEGPVYLTSQERERKQSETEETAFLTALFQVLRAELARISGADLVDVRQQVEGEEIKVTAVVNAPNAVEPSEVGEIEAAVRRETGKPVHLVVRSVLTQDADAKRYLHLPETPRPEPADEALRATIRGTLQRELARRIQGASLVEARVRQERDELVVEARVRAPSIPTAAQVSQLEQALLSVDPRTRLVVRATVGAEVSRQGYVLPPPPEPPPAAERLPSTGTLP
jgi:uncharacterized hydrophobic protein (TIGR00271 family)